MAEYKTPIIVALISAILIYGGLLLIMYTRQTEGWFAEATLIYGSFFTFWFVCSFVGSLAYIAILLEDE